ncbi:MAG: helix-turn-helix domain-containing protein [Oricola sp.]
MTKPGHVSEIGEVCRPVGELLQQIGSKWVVLVLIRLSERPKRFSELKREIGTISQKVLTGVLRDLERNGIVDRTVTPSIPPRVDYRLTDLGESLLEPIHALGRWAVENEDAVAEARARFEERVTPA